MRFVISFFITTILLFSFFVLFMLRGINIDLEPLIDYKPPLATRIYDAQDRLIANLFEDEFRLYIKFDDIPPRLIEALVAVEDTLFFEHNGINIDAIFRAATKNIQEGRLAEGASTLTQQLIKSTLLSHEKTFNRKIIEAIMALKLETMLSKEEILERYLNQVYFGHGYYGVRTASLGYFHKEPNRLTLKEIAMLVSLPKAPSFYDPTKNQEYSLSRANNVLMRLYSLGWITKKELDEALRETPIVYNESLTQNKAPYVVDEIVRQLKGKIKDLKTGGYIIKTTIDLKTQEIAEEALRYGHSEILKRKNKENEKINGAMVVLESQTGKILALVGGVDYEKSSFNRATMSKRQPGSSFKPFIYQMALNLGYSPVSKIPDIARTFKYVVNGELKVWQPENYEKEFEGLVTIEEAVVKSINLATINLVDEIGLNKFLKEVEKYGFDDLPQNLSIALGSFGISPLEMSQNYTIFSNYGTKVTPILISEITDRFGKKSIFEATKKEVIPPYQAYLMIDLLKKVVLYGTGKRAMVDGIELAGKTGTTNNNVDSWFCGFSPSIEAIVWYGKDDNTPMAKTETGGVAAAPAFGYFFKKYLEYRPEIERKFSIPKGVGVSLINGKEVLFTEISKIPPSAYENSDEKPIF